MTDEVSENTTVETAEVETPSIPDLTITDLATFKTIIELASSRGVFKPLEMRAVGVTYTKLSQFLNFVSKKAEEKAND